MTKQQLQDQLLRLQLKWKGKVPDKSSPLYWEFRCDRCIGIGLRTQIDHLPEENLQTAAELIFG